MPNKIKLVMLLCFIICTALAARIIRINCDEAVISASNGRGRYRLTQISSYGTIYDCSGKPLNNIETSYEALINPNSYEAKEILPFIANATRYENGMKSSVPFTCEVSEKCKEDSRFIVFEQKVRTGKNQSAKHIVGYTSDNKGVCGIEYAYDDLLRGNYSENEAIYTVNAVGGVLEGLYSEIKYADEVKAGVVTSLDSDIQQICENAVKLSGCKKGAVIIMDIKSGEIKACLSFPEFNPEALADSLNDENKPFINRAFCSYSVGSIFKLVTAAAALETGISQEYTADCTGSIDINGQLFNCHKWGGHGEINMNDAIVQSCNPYFISLSAYLDRDKFIQTAKRLGFGAQTDFCDGVSSAQGYLPSADEISVKAECANLSFGQGKLSATPLQICRMTAAIANNGVISEPKLILGTFDGGGAFSQVTYAKDERVLSYLTALKLKVFMKNMVNTGNCYAKSQLVAIAGKTSTAQTGRYFDDGREKLNCWFTGYFPADKPQYAMTVLIEERTSGNSAAAPIFRVIAENITRKATQTKPASAKIKAW